MWNREAMTIRRERECAEESVAFVGHIAPAEGREDPAGEPADALRGLQRPQERQVLTSAATRLQPLHSVV